MCKRACVSRVGPNRCFDNPFAGVAPGTGVVFKGNLLEYCCDVHLFFSSLYPALSFPSSFSSGGRVRAIESGHASQESEYDAACHGKRAAFDEMRQKAG